MKYILIGVVALIIGILFGYILEFPAGCYLLLNGRAGVNSNRLGFTAPGLSYLSVDETGGNKVY